VFLLQSIYLDEPVSKKSASVELEEVTQIAQLLLQVEDTEIAKQ